MLIIFPHTDDRYNSCTVYIISLMVYWYHLLDEFQKCLCQYFTVMNYNTISLIVF